MRTASYRPAGRQPAGILPGREVHVDQLHLHRGIHPAPGQRVPGGKLQSEQVPGRPAAGVGLVPGGTGSVQTGQHGVPYPELGALVGHGIAGSADVQPQGIGTYRIAGVQLGAAPGRRLPQAAQQKSERKADAQVLHLPARESILPIKKQTLLLEMISRGWVCKR